MSNSVKLEYLFVEHKIRKSKKYMAKRLRKLLRIKCIGKYVDEGDSTVSYTICWIQHRGKAPLKNKGYGGKVACP